MGLVVVVETVGAEGLYYGGSFHLLFGYVVEVDACGVALVFHVQAELLFLHRRGEVIHVFHHQRPVALRGVVAGVFQRLHEQGLRHVGHVARELTHLIGLPAIGVLIGHGKHLVGLQRVSQRHVTQGVVHGVFRRVEQARVLQLLIVGTAVQSRSVEHGRRLVYVARRAVGASHGLIFGVGLVGRHVEARRGPHRVAHLGVLAKVGQGYDVSGVGCRSALVGHPNLHAVDGHARGEVGQRAHAVVVVVVEIAREEEVAVLLIVGGVELKRRQLLAALRRHALRRALLLRGHELELQLAELQVGA